MGSTKKKNLVTIDDCWNRIGVWSKTDVERCPKLAKYVHCRNCNIYSAAGRKLLNRDLPDNYQDEWTKAFSEEKEKELVGAKSAFVFRAGLEWLALDASLIKEVIGMGPIHTLPHLTNNVLRGVVNVHGKLEICVSIGAVLGIDRLEERELDAQYATPERLVVVFQKNYILTFPVSEVIGIVRYTRDMIRELPVTVSGSKAVYTMGILCLEDKDVGFLKDKPLFNTLTRDLE